MAAPLENQPYRRPCDEYDEKKLLDFIRKRTLTVKGVEQCDYYYTHDDCDVVYRVSFLDGTFNGAMVFYDHLVVIESGVRPWGLNQECVGVYLQANRPLSDTC